MFMKVMRLRPRPSASGAREPAGSWRSPYAWPASHDCNADVNLMLICMLMSNSWTSKCN